MRSFLSRTGWIVVFVIAALMVTAVACRIVAEAAPLPIPIPYRLTVDYVIDGDTFAFIRPPTMDGWVVAHVRVDGIDTPEHVKPPARKSCEVKMGLHATDVAKTILHPGDPVVVLWDGKTHEKYGRLLGRVTLADGRDYGDLMIAAGAARAYDGKTKPPWC